MTPARLFNARFRGFRIVDIASLGVLSVLVLGVYGTKALAGREGAQIADIDQQISEEHQRVRLLKAELAHLEQPGRLVRLSTDYLGLAPISAKRESPPEALTQIALQATTPASKLAAKPAAKVATAGTTPATVAAPAAAVAAASTPVVGSVVQ